MTHAKQLTAGALAALMVFGSVPAMAQTAVPDVAAPEVPAADFPQEKIDAFVLAAVDLSTVRSEYEVKIAEAASEEDAQEIAVEGQAKMVEAVESADGITIAEYNEIGAAAQSDPDLAQRLTMLIEEQMDTAPNAPTDPAGG